MKKIGIVSLLLVLILILVQIASFAASGQYYTALGDSIAVGTGIVYNSNPNYGYVDMLTQKDFDAGKTYDLAVNGLTSAGLLSTLTKTADPNYSATRAAVIKANVLTISIGGNDLLQTLIPLYTKDPNFLSKLSTMNKLILASKLMSNANSFGTNWQNIIKTIRALNPNAVIYVNTLYNPFKTSDSNFTFADVYIKTINNSIKKYPATYKYKIADVYTAFKGKDGMIFGLDGLVPLHPTYQGYEVIYGLHKALMPS